MDETPEYDRMFKRMCPSCTTSNVTITHHMREGAVEHYTIICGECPAISLVTEALRD